jgi:hypothetical protein
MLSQTPGDSSPREDAPAEPPPPPDDGAVPVPWVKQLQGHFISPTSRACTENCTHRQIYTHVCKERDTQSMSAELVYAH